MTSSSSQFTTSLPRGLYTTRSWFTYSRTTPAYLSTILWRGTPTATESLLIYQQTILRSGWRLSPTILNTAERCYHSVVHTLSLRREVINPRRACAARVTVVVLCVCLSVCLRLFRHHRQRYGMKAIRKASVLQALEN